MLARPCGPQPPSARHLRATAIQRHGRYDRVETLQRAVDEHPETGGNYRGAGRTKQRSRMASADAASSALLAPIIGSGFDTPPPPDYIFNLLGCSSNDPFVGCNFITPYRISGTNVTTSDADLIVRIDFSYGHDVSSGLLIPTTADNRYLLISAIVLACYGAFLRGKSTP
jgi:hypothetical protein